MLSPGSPTVTSGIARETDHRWQPIAKRRVALLRSMGKNQEAITALTTLLGFTPIESEGWAELSDLYLSEGLYAQAIHALEGVLVLVPNAWNVCPMGGSSC